MRCFLWFAICFSAFAVDAEPLRYRKIQEISLKEIFGTQSDWHVTTWQPEGMESADVDAAIGDTPAKICFWVTPAQSEKNCTLTRSMLPNSVTYNYQTASRLAVLPINQTFAPAPLLIFEAQFSGGGSGVLNQTSFWAYDKELDSFEESGLITLTEQGEYQFVSVRSKALLVTADANWGEGETHFSPHQFYIEAYRYEPKGGYEKVLGYLTPDKYPSLDDVDRIDVVSHEISQVKNLLAAIANALQ